MFAGCHLTSLVTRTNHNTIDVYVRIIRTEYHARQIFIPHRQKFILSRLGGLVTTNDLLCMQHSHLPPLSVTPRAFHSKLKSHLFNHSYPDPSDHSPSPSQQYPP